MSYALLIDDDEQLRSRLSSMAEMAGLRLETAATWQEGLEVFTSLSPDLVIADYNLLGRDMGLSLLYRISQLRPSVRLVLFSAFLDEDDAEAVVSMGPVHRVLSKLDPIYAAEEILKEVQLAETRSHESTDWNQLAASAIRAREVDQAQFEALDDYLRANRLGGAES